MPGSNANWTARRRFRRFTKSALHSMGLVSVIRRLSRNGVRILAYHRFPTDVRGLHRQCEHIRRHYTPVSMADIAANHHHGVPLPPNSLAVTVDDGYHDFLTFGHPVFEMFDVPATVFLVSNFIDGTLWLWWDAVEYALNHTRRQAMTFSLPDGSKRNFELTTATEREVAHVEICAAMTALTVTDRIQAFAGVARVLDVAVPSSPTAAYAPLTWEQIRGLTSRRVEFGAHTKTHPILSRVSDQECLRDEIISSKTRIEAEIGRPVIHFCYPNGRREDFTDAAVDLVSSGGFQTAVTTMRGINFSGVSPFLLRRLGVAPDDPMPYFEELLAGVRAA